MSELPSGTPISQLTFEQLQESRPRVEGWIYPKRDISGFIPLFSKGQRAAINFYGWVAFAMILVGIALPIFLGSWWWLLLVPGATIVWRANRQSMEQFFLENLQANSEFYDAVRQTEVGEFVRVVLKDI